MKSASILGLSVLFSLVLFSCGYHLSSSSPIELPQGISTLYIDKVENPTTKAWLESALISEVRDEFTRRGRVQWVERAQAQGLVHLIVTRYSDQTSVEGADEETLKSEISMTLVGKILAAQKKEVIWVSRPVHARESFTGSSEKTRAEERVIQDAADDLANQLSAGF